MATKARQARRKRTARSTAEAKRQRERDQFMKKAIAAAVEWATKELAKVRKQGLLPNEAADHILTEVGRRWNTGTMNAVEKRLDLHPTQPDDEEEEEDDGFYFAVFARS
jgi:hypothetical protein